MQDLPRSDALVATIARFLREDVALNVKGRLVYDLRVAANALELVARALVHGERADVAELERLGQLLGTTGGLMTLNKEFCQHLRDGRMDFDTPGVANHLWRTTLDKLSIDQPSYAAYRAEIAARSA